MTPSRLVRVALVDELERVERELLGALGRADLNAASALLHDDFLITTAGWIAEPVGKEAWLGSLSERMTLESFDLRLLATQRCGANEPQPRNKAQSVCLSSRGLLTYL